MRSRPASLTAVIVIALAATALVGASSASAANVVNGDFEAGTLAGWQVYLSNPQVQWVAEESEEAQLTAPLSGRFVALSLETETPGTTVLYEDVALEPASSHLLQMTLFYSSEVPIVVPDRYSLDSEGSFPNQQFRVDVMKPNAPLESLSPNDILATVFATSESENAGEQPHSMQPRQFSVDLSAFAGQTVQLRLAVAAGVGRLYGGVDAVSIASAPLPIAPPAPPPPAPRPLPRIQKGKLTLDRMHGTGKLAVTVPAAGTLTVMDGNAKVAIASLASRAGEARKPALIKTATLHPNAAGTLAVAIKPTKAGRRILGDTGKLKFRARLTYTPDGGTASTQIYKARLFEAVKAKR